MEESSQPKPDTTTYHALMSGRVDFNPQTSIYGKTGRLMPLGINPPVQTLMEKLEKDGEKKAIELWKRNETPENACESLKNIMSSGAKEFKEKTGRQMTYSEMRQLYG